ncbi:HepT-like ribonuclease domain-containing protein [Nitratifractor sp.]
MSDKSQEAKASFILEQIDRIEKITERHGGIVKALEDFEGEMAIFMGISQIGEALSKLDRALVERFDLAREQDGAYYTRNYIVHDYENVDRLIIEDILRRHLPVLKEKIANLRQYLKQRNA